jgi:hypothetical protein
MQGMAYSFLVFDFGGNEDAAQQARHRIEGWKQAFRLDKKLQVKFDRGEPVTAPEAPPAAPPKGKAATKSKSAGKSDSKSAEATVEPTQIHVIVRLDFSDHEKLSRQRWLDRIPAEEPFKSAHPKIVRGDESEFQATSDLFDSLD